MTERLAGVGETRAVGRQGLQAFLRRFCPEVSLQRQHRIALRVEDEREVNIGGGLLAMGGRN